MNRTVTGTKIIFDEPAAEWHEALPIGNGRLGAMVFGGTLNEVLAINEDTLWCGCPESPKTSTVPLSCESVPHGSSSQHVNEAGQWYKAVSKLAKQRKYVEAHNFAYNSLSNGRETSPYSFFGNLLIRTTLHEDLTARSSDNDNAPALRDACSPSFTRYLDLENAIAVTEYSDKHNTIVRKCFASAPDNCIAVIIIAKEPVDISVSLEGGCLLDVSEENNMLLGHGRCFRTNPDEEGNAIEYIGAVGILLPTKDGSYCYTTKAQCVREATILLSVHSNYKDIIARHNNRTADRNDQLVPDTDKLIADMEALKKPYSKLLETHIADYRLLYDRVSLTLPADKKLYETLFNYGRYLMISGSRPGSQPANLQGIWNDSLTPPWSSNYTVNINTEMNYWLTGPCRLHECAEPLLTLCEELLGSGRQTAVDYFGVSGTCSFHNVDLWRKSTPSAGSPMWNCWPLGSQWLCRNLYDESLFINDEAYLRRIEPVMRENLRFCLELAIESSDGITLSPGTSPENEFWWKDDEPDVAFSTTHDYHPKAWNDWETKDSKGCSRVAVAYYSENENAIFRNLCRDYIECCNRLKISNELYSRALDILPKIVPTRIDSRGRIMEWNEEFPEYDEHHRHLSHLYELHPGRGISSADKVLFDAARNSLLMRGDDGTGWSLAWKLIMWARMKDGQHAGSLLSLFTRHVDVSEDIYAGGGGIFTNLFCAHPPFQIDGNFGFTAGIAELLVQSHEDHIHVLPAIPPDWTEFNACGLGCRGGIIADIERVGTKLKVTFHSDKPCTIKYRIGSGEIKTAYLQNGLYFAYEGE